MNTLCTFERPPRRIGNGNKIFSNIVRLPHSDSGMAHSIIRLNNCHIGKSRIPRRTALFIKNSHNNQWIIRYAMGNSGSVSKLTKNTIALDYDAICDMGVQYEQSVSIIVRKATVFQSMVWLSQSTDLNVRLSFRLAVLGAVLGLTGLLISLPSYFQ